MPKKEIELPGWAGPSDSKAGKESDVVRLYDDSKRSRRHEETQSGVNLAFFVGLQHITKNVGSTNVISVGNRPTWQIRHSDNHILPAVRHWTSKFAISNIQMYVVPETSDEDDVQKAKVSERILQYQDFVNKTKRRRRKTIQAMLIFGRAYEKTWFDSEMRAENDKGERIKGDVRTEFVPARYIHFDSGADSLYESAWVIHERYLTENEAKAMLSAKELEKSGEIKAVKIETGPIDTVLGMVNATWLERVGVQVLEYWERPSGEHENGVYKLVVQGSEVRESELPYYKDTEGYVDIPFTEYKFVPIPEIAYATSLVEQMLPHQKYHNKIMSTAAEHFVSTAHPKLLRPMGVSRSVKLTSQPGQEIPYQGSEKPSYMQTPDFPQYAFTMLDKNKDGEDNVASFHDVSRGEAPRNIRSGLGVAYLQEKDDTTIGDLVQATEESFEQEATYRLHLAKAYYDKKRVGRIVGSRRKSITFYFSSENIGSTDVRVEAGSALPTNKTAKMNILVEMKKEEIVDAAYVRRRMEVMDYSPDVDPTPSEERARHENLEMKQGGFPKVAMVDNAQEHINEHMYWAEENWDELSTPIRAYVMRHIRIHMLQAQGDNAWAIRETGEENPMWSPYAYYDTTNPPPMDPLPGETPAPAAGGSQMTPQDEQALVSQVRGTPQPGAGIPPTQPQPPVPPAGAF